jgi:hypothetical protein
MGTMLGTPDRDWINALVVHLNLDVCVCMCVCVSVCGIAGSQGGEFEHVFWDVAPVLLY